MTDIKPGMDRFGYHNPCPNKDCTICKSGWQVHLNVDEEIDLADWLNRSLKIKFQEDNK